jgi:hypothetical protein
MFVAGEGKTNTLTISQAGLGRLLAYIIEAVF